MYELFTLNEYYNVKNKNETINIGIYNPKWQKLIDLTLQDDYNKRPNIEEIYNYIKNEIDINNNKNEITCIYYKSDKNSIKILYDFFDYFYQKYNKESYNKAKNNINEDNIEIYVNDKKIKFNCYYEGDEIGLIKVKFKFNKPLTSTAFMFYYCMSLKSIDLSSFNTNNVTDMRDMFSFCYSLKSVNLSSFNTCNVINMGCMFDRCGALESIDLYLFYIFDFYINQIYFLISII